MTWPEKLVELIELSEKAHEPLIGMRDVFDYAGKEAFLHCDDMRFIFNQHGYIQSLTMDAYVKAD